MNDGNYQRFSKGVLKYNKGTENISEKLILCGVVRQVCLNENSPLFEDNGGYNSIGLVIFDLQEPTIGLLEDLRAMPLNPNVRHYPLIGESIMVVKGQSVNPQTVNQGVDAYYYLQPIGLFNNPTYNPFTTTFMDYSLPYNLNKDTEQLFPSKQGRITETESQIQGFEANPEGQSKFVDKGNIRPLRIFTGDIIYQGRYGNGIRFSSTATNNDNSWSQTDIPSEYGDPIMILSNGTPDNPNNIESFVPHTENPTDDKSSIYLTTTQKLPINFPKANYNASTDPPIALNQYNRPQILLNSDRSVLSSKNDSTIIQSAISVNISSNSVGIDAKNEFVIDSNKIRLGNNNANEAAMLGNKTNRLLIQALNSISDLAATLQDLQNWPGGSPVPNQNVIMQAVTTENIVNQVLDNLKNKNNLSEVTKTV